MNDDTVSAGEPDDAVREQAASDSEHATPEERRALFRVVRGAPSDPELAALAAVLAASTGGGDEAPARRREVWSDPAAQHRTALVPGVGAWRSAFWRR